MRSLPSHVLTAVTSLLLLACGSSKDQTRLAPESPAAPVEKAPVEQAVRSEAESGANMDKIDINSDGKPDVFKYYRLVDAGPAQNPNDQGAKVQKKVLVRKELDVNFDQRTDIIELYEGEPGKEQKVREEMDMDFDGRMDMTRSFKDGNLTMVEMDLGFDGKMDSWSYYQMSMDETGKPVNRLLERRRDNNGDGKVDVWEYYMKGELQKIGTDTDGDGQPDQYRKAEKTK